MPRNRVSAVLGSSVPRPRPQPFPSRSRSTLRRRAVVGAPRAALARADHDLLPLRVGRGAPPGRGRRGDGAPPLRGGGRARRATVQGRLRLLRRSRAREAGELASQAAGERAATEGAAGPVGARAEPRPPRPAEVHRQPALPGRLLAGEHADHLLGERVRAAGRDRGRLRSRHQAGHADRHTTAWWAV